MPNKQHNEQTSSLQHVNDTGGWDDRTSTLTFHTFRPKSPAELIPVSGVTHQMLNGTYDKRKHSLNNTNTNNRQDSPPNYDSYYGNGYHSDGYHGNGLHGNEYASFNVADNETRPMSSNGVYASPKPSQRLYYYQTPEEINNNDNISLINAKSCVDIFVNLSLKSHENRAGFSMSGGQNRLPTTINNVLEGSPADRAGLCPGDEILEINGLPMINASYNEIIQHIHECIKSRNLQLKIRRKPEIPPNSDFAAHSNQLSNGNLYTAEAFMVSVDENHKPDLNEKLRTFHPNLKITDMERVTSSSPPANRHAFKNGHVTHYGNGTVLIDEGDTDNITSNNRPRYNLQENGGTVETSFVQNGYHGNKYNYEKNKLNSPITELSQKSQPISVGQYYGSKASVKSVNNGPTAPVHKSSNNNLNGLRSNGSIPASSVEESTPRGKNISNNLNNGYGNNNNGKNDNSSSVNGEEDADRLKRYELDLRKRREAEDKQAKEEEFLRSSLRGSKKLQALEQSDREHSSSCHENIGFLDDDHYVQNGFENGQGNDMVDRPIALEDVLMSVNRLTEVLDQMPEHQRDSQFIRDLFSEKIVQNAIDVTAVSRIHFADRDKLTPVSKSSFHDSQTILNQLGDSVSDQAGDLQLILEQPHVRGALYAHDKIAEQLPDVEPSTSFANMQPLNNSFQKEVLGLMETRLEGGADNFRIIKLFKDGDHPLGATVKNDAEAIVIGRVVKGGVAEKSGLLKEGDEILEVNGTDVRGKTVHEVCDMLANLSGEISFVVVPAPPETIVDGPPHAVVKHVRALFNYDPEDDIYLPCRELGLHFGKGDILHVISMTDSNWWQALRDGEESMHQLAGLVPSASLQTQKEQYNKEVKAEVDKENDNENVSGFLCTKRKKPKRNVNTLSKSSGKDKIVAPPGVEEEDIPTYEEVSLYLSPTGRRRPVILVGPLHVGCLELRQKLMETEKDKFAGVVPHTSRPRRVDEQDGVHYYFVTKQQFQDDVTSRQFIEWGEYQKHFYGTSFDSIKRVMDRGKTCVLTLKAQNLKGLRNSDFMPFVVFISPPSFERLKFNKQKAGEKDLKEDELRSIISEAKELEDKFGHLFDKILVNFDLDRTFQELRMAIHRLETEPQWVPSGWLKNPNASLSR